MTLALSLYRTATGLLEPMAGTVLNHRAKRGKEDFGRLNERLGRPRTPRPPGPLIWLHGVSVGETQSLLPLVDALRSARRDAQVLVTSGTVTSAELLARRLPGSVIHQFAPIDAPRAVAGFLDHWRPDVGVLVESELWPNLIQDARRRGVKLALASARITERTARGWSRLPGAARELLAAFDLVLPQDDDSDARLARLGRPGDGRLNLKYATEPLPFDGRALTALRKEADGRTVLLAASTHEGEDALVLEAFQALDGERLGKPRLVVVPRHRERGRAIAEQARAMGFATGRHGEGDAFSSLCDVYVADTLGELGQWFRLADSAFLGGSLLPGIGGHNPLEAVQVGTPAITGPHVANWEGVYADLAAAELVQVLPAPGDLTAAWEVALDTAEPRKVIEKRAAELQQRRRREFDDAVARIAGLLS